MKKRISLILAGLLCLALSLLSACSGTPDDGGNGGGGNGGDGGTTTPPVIHKLSADGGAVCDVCGETLFSGTMTFALSENAKYYTAESSDASGAVVLPAYYKGRGDADYLPVLEVGDMSSGELTSLEFSPLTESVTGWIRAQNLQKYLVPEANEHFKAEDGVLFDAAGATLVSWPGRHAGTAYTVPAGVKELFSHSFYKAGLERVVLPASLERIGDKAFEDCASLSEAELPAASALKYVGYSAFNGCGSLETISLPASLEQLGANAFTRCTSLVSVTVPADAALSEIDDGTFSSCSSLASFVIPENVKKIGSYAFQNCTMASIVLPRGITTVSYNAFNGWVAPQTIHVRLQKAELPSGWGKGWSARADVVYGYTGA